MNQLDKRTHLVLGGGGFVGRHVALRLAQAGHKVVTAGRRTPPLMPADVTHCAIEHILFDIQNGDWDSLVSRCDIIHHYAWTTSPKTASANPLADLQLNVGAMISLLEALRHHGGKRLIFTSSGGTVYGRLRTERATEDHPLDPISAYGAAKVAAEKYVGIFQAQYGVDGRIARLANPYGAGQDPGHGVGAVTNFLHYSRQGKDISIWGDGSVVRDYIHIADAAEALVRLSLASIDPAARGTPTFNIGSGEGRSLNQIVDAIRALTGKPVEVKYSAARPSDVPFSVLDISRAMAALDWRPALSFEEGLSRMLSDIAAGRTFYSSLD